MHSRTPNLLHRSGKFYFRIRVPTNLRHRFCRLELKFSLMTSDRREATRRTKVITGKINLLFQELDFNRGGLLTNLTPDRLKEIVREYAKNGFNIESTPKDPHDVDL